MSRAEWKGPYVSNKLILQCQNAKKLEYLEEILTDSRSSTVTPNFVGNTFKIHNGKNYSTIKINENMIGKKLGEFSPTRKKFSFKKKKLK